MCRRGHKLLGSLARFLHSLVKRQRTLRKPKPPSISGASAMQQRDNPSEHRPVELSIAQTASTVEEARIDALQSLGSVTFPDTTIQRKQALPSTGGSSAMLQRNDCSEHQPLKQLTLRALSSVMLCRRATASRLPRHGLCPVAPCSCPWAS